MVLIGSSQVRGRSSAGVDSSSSDALFIPSVANEAVSSGDSEADIRPSRERTQHTRPAEGLERSVSHNEWSKGNYHLLLSISYVFWLLRCWGGHACAFSCPYKYFVFLAGLDVPGGAAWLSASQVLAFSQAAVRL